MKSSFQMKKGEKGLKMMGVGDNESQLRIDNHVRSKDIKNPWNCFLMEVKLIRDYFVKEVVSSQSGGQ